MSPKSQAPPLTTTSYAILGLIAVKPWTTYELAQQMRRALGQFWPRAESKLYEEPKKLVAHGLARAASEMVGERPRTVYSITAKGRRALAAWVPTPGAGPALEFEALIKIFYAEHGSKDDLVGTIARVRGWTDERHRASAGISRGYLEDQGSFPERLPWLILVGRFLDEFTRAVERWTEWAEQEVASWPEDLADAEPNRSVLEDMAIHSEEYLAALDERGG
jgi:PadR family transcriptional regulator, regulatory protein AphA